jgi:hypothetical protein
MKNNVFMLSSLDFGRTAPPLRKLPEINTSSIRKIYIYSDIFRLLFAGHMLLKIMVDTLNSQFFVLLYSFKCLPSIRVMRFDFLFVHLPGESCQYRRLFGASYVWRLRCGCLFVHSRIRSGVSRIIFATCLRDRASRLTM